MNQIRKFYKRHPYAAFALCAACVLGVMFLHYLVFPGVCAMGAVFATAPAALSEEQVTEFRNTLAGLKTALGEYKDLFPALKDLGTVEGGFAAIKKLPDTLKALVIERDTYEKELKAIKKQILAGKAGSGVRYVGEKAFVTDDCARAFAAIYVCHCAQRGVWPGAFRGEDQQKAALAMACDVLGMEQKTALTTTEIPVPTIYVPQVIELVYKYGAARQYATVFPLGNGTVKLPRLKAGEDDFGYLGVGTAGMSQTVNEKRVTAELVTFTANKFGGIIRIPTELEEDTFIPLGQFLARYIGRQFAKMEDKTLFLGDGTATYANISGVGKYCDSNATYLLQLGAGSVNPNDATLDDFRNLRAKVSAAVLAGGFDAAYYLNPTWEPFLVKFNKYPNFIVFVRNSDGTCTLDGYPVRWIGVSQAFQTTAAASAYLAFFGALQYWYLGERGAPRVEVSKDVYFTTDELAMRALERIDVEGMAIDAMATLKTAAA